METIQDNNVKFKMIVKNFTENFSDNGKRIDSKNIVNYGNDGSKTKWCLSVYPKGRRSEDKGYVSLYLCLNHMEKKKLDVKYKFAILNENDEEVHTVQRLTIYRKTTGCGLGQFIKRDQLFAERKLLLPNNTLTLICEFVILENGIEDDSIYQKYETVKDQLDITNQELQELKDRYEFDEDGLHPEHQLLNDIKYLFVNEVHTDVVFRIGSDMLYAHRAILSARSKVFAAMFETEVVNGSKVTIDIPDIPFKVMLEILRFIYTGVVEDLDQMAIQLFAAAEKYHLEGLMELCERSMGQSMSVDTALATFILADTKSLPELKQIGRNFIRENLKFLMSREEWITFVTKYPTLLYDVLSQL